VDFATTASQNGVCRTPRNVPYKIVLFQDGSKEKIKAIKNIMFFVIA
jgi:hypothetical protein